MTYNIKELENKNRIFNEKLIEEEDKISKLKKSIRKLEEPILSITTQTIQAKTRKLVANWSIETEKDLINVGSVNRTLLSWAGYVFDENVHPTLILPVKGQM